MAKNKTKRRKKDPPAAKMPVEVVDLCEDSEEEPKKSGDRKPKIKGRRTSHTRRGPLYWKMVKSRDDAFSDGESEDPFADSDEEERATTAPTPKKKSPTTAPTSKKKSSTTAPTSPKENVVDLVNGGSKTAPKKMTAEVELGSLEHVLFQTLQDSNSTMVHFGVCKLGKDLLMKNPERINAFFNQGGHGILKVTMEKWENHRLIQRACCTCIAKVLQESPEKCELFLQLKALELVLRALVVHGKNQDTGKRFDPFLYCEGLAAASALVKGSRSTKTTETATKSAMKRFAEDFDGISLVLTAMAKSTFREIHADGSYLLEYFISSGITTPSKLKMVALAVVADVSETGAATSCQEIGKLADKLLASVL